MSWVPDFCVPTGQVVRKSLLDAVMDTVLSGFTQRLRRADGVRQTRVQVRAAPRLESVELFLLLYVNCSSQKFLARRRVPP